MEAISSGDPAVWLREVHGHDDEKSREFLGAAATAIRAALASGRSVPLAGLGTLKLTGPPSAVPADAPAWEAARALGPEAAGLLDLLTAELRRRVMLGQPAWLPGVGTWALVPRVPPREHGKKATEPVKIELRFLGDGTVERGGRDCAIKLEAGPEILQAVEARGSGAVLLAMPSSDEFTGFLQLALQQEGWPSKLVSTSAEALSEVEVGETTVAVVDATLEGAAKLCLELKARQPISMVPLVVIHPRVQNLLRPRELCVLGDENLTEPFEVRALLNIIESEAMRAAEERLTKRHVLHCQFPTAEPFVEGAIDLFARCVKASGLAEEQQVALSSAVKEAVLNAATHGNKSQKDKKIEMQYVLDADQVTVSVRDYGAGFDHRKFLVRGKDGSAVAAARERHQEGRMGGLGIMLMVRCADDVEYSSVGNRVKLTKVLAGRRAKR